MIEHHRSLSPGHYRGQKARPGQIVLLRETNSQKLYLIKWEGKDTMHDNFEVEPEGGLANWEWERSSCGG